MGDLEEGYIGIVPRNDQGREIEGPVIPGRFSENYFLHRPIGPEDLSPLSRDLPAASRLPPRPVANSRTLAPGNPIALAPRVVSYPPSPLALAPPLASIPHNLGNTSSVLRRPSTTISGIQVRPGSKSVLKLPLPRNLGNTSPVLIVPGTTISHIEVLRGNKPVLASELPPPITPAPPPPITLAPPSLPIYKAPYPLITLSDLEKIDSDFSPLIEGYVGGKRKRSRKTKKSKQSKKSKAKNSRKYLRR